MIGIYKITSPSNKVYIGQSRNIKRRFRQYRNLNCKSQNKLYCSFIHYGIDRHIFEIIEICHDTISTLELDEKEINFISLFKNNNIELLNISLGGKSGTGKSRLGKKESPEANAKKRIWMKGKKNSLGYKHTEEYLKKASERMEGKQIALGKTWILTEEQKQRYIGNKYSLGIKHSKEFVEKHSIRMIGNNYRIGKTPINAKKILNTITGEVYSSIVEAADKNNLIAGTLTARLNGRLINKTNLKYYEENRDNNTCN